MVLDRHPRLQLLAAALCFSTGGAVIKAISLSGWYVAGLRSLIAAAVIFVLAPRSRGLFTWRQWVVGAIYASMMVSFVLANKWTTAAHAIFLQSTAPLYILVVAPKLLGERIRRLDLFACAAILVGMALLLWGDNIDQPSAPAPGLGNGIGAVSGVFWAGTLLGLRFLGREDTTNDAADPAAQTVVLGNLIAFGACIPGMLLSPADFDGKDLALLGFLGVFQIGAAYAFLTRAIRRVPAFAAALLVLLEPALSPVWSYAVHRELLTVLNIVGAACIVLATVAKSWADTRAHPPQLEETA